MSFEQLPDEKGKKSRSGSKNPKIPEVKGKRAVAHEEATLDIDIDEVVTSARPPTRLAPTFKPERHHSAPAPAPATSGVQPRATLSVTDYKRRMGIL